MIHLVAEFVKTSVDNGRLDLVSSLDPNTACNKKAEWRHSSFLLLPLPLCLLVPALSLLTLSKLTLLAL